MGAPKIIPVDTDGNGKFDELQVHVDVDLAEAGTYQYQATLQDGCYNTIEEKYGTLAMPGDFASFVISFSGELIGCYGVDGPYRFWSVYLYRTATDRAGRSSSQAVDLFREPAKREIDLKASDFEAFLPPKDCNGNGKPDRCDIRQDESKDDNFNGVPDECQTEDQNYNYSNTCKSKYDKTKRNRSRKTDADERRP